MIIIFQKRTYLSRSERICWGKGCDDLHDREPHGFIIDLDGTVYAGDTLIPGAAAAIRQLQTAQIPFVFLSNRGNYARKMCQQKLLGMGITVALDHILLSSTVTARYLAQTTPKQKIWVLGGEGLKEELLLHSLTLANTPQEAECLVITLHEQLTYHDLNQAFRAVRAGARIIATNEDRSFPGRDGACIDVAGMIGAITASTGQAVERVLGKPSVVMAEAAMKQLGIPAERCIVIGDSLESDIQMAQRAGMSSVLVWSGSAREDQMQASAWQPTWTADNLQAFIESWIGKGEQVHDDNEWLR